MAGKRRGPHAVPSPLGSETDQPFDAADMSAEDRALYAYRLHVLGYTYREIAHIAQYGSHQTAMRAVKHARDKVVVRDLRALTARQADRIEYAVSTVMKAIEGWPSKDKLWAVDRLQPLLKRESELFGLDASRDVPVIGTPKVRVLRKGEHGPSPAPIPVQGTSQEESDDATE